MAKAKAKELRDLAADAIASKVKEMEANLFNMWFLACRGMLENTTLLQTTRRVFARAKTVLQQKSVAGK